MTSPKEWHADIIITEETVKQCLQAQFPNVPLHSVHYLSEGWDNKVFVVNDEWVFRFPRRKIAVELTERENKVLDRLPSFGTIHIPVPVYKGQPSVHYPYPFQGYKIIQGISGHHAQLTETERAATMVPFAIFLRQLHCITPSQALAIGAEPQVFDRTCIQKTVAILKERITAITARHYCVLNQAECDREIAMAENIVLPPEKTCLIHGDIDCRHMLFSQKQLTGIIDWGDMGISNPSVDLASIWSFYPPDSHAAFFEIYGAVDTATWHYARFLGLYSALTLFLYGSDIQDKLLAKESFQALMRINRKIVMNTHA